MDFFEALDALPDKDFFEALDEYEVWTPSQVGDRYIDKSDSYGVKQWVVIEVGPYDEEMHSNNIVVVPDGSVPDKHGKYDIVGFTSQAGLRRKANAGKLRKI